jgi:pyruvate dehydrogenase E1 component beta subunit
MAKLTYLQAINRALHEEMTRDESVFLMGEDIAFNFTGATGGLVDAFGPERIRNTPIAEAGFVGAAAGAAMVGMRPVVDIMIAPFLYCAFDQIVSIIAKSTYLYGGQTRMPLTIRAPMFYSGGIAAQHSDRPISTFMTIPGLKIVAPTTPADALGLLKAAIRDDDPVLYFDDKRLWASAEDVPDGEHLVAIGQGDVKRAGCDVTIVAVAGSIAPALDAADHLLQEGISAEVIDPRTLVPLDLALILESVEKTGRLVIADPCHRTCSAASEIAAAVAEEGFWSLEAPIVRVTTPDTHIPFSPPLEQPLYPNAERIVDAVRETLS